MIIENLTLIKSIGKGAFGEVFLASKKDVAQKFAVKKVSRGLVYQEKVKKYFNNEIFILKNISHPNIIKLYDIKQTLNNFYLVFDLCNGGGLSNCLEEYMRENLMPFTEEITQHIMRQLVSAIQYLHNKRILHRDLKLDNILLNFNTEEDKNNKDLLKAQVKLIDFGFARYLEKDTLAVSLLGSPINMAPQILAKMRKMDNNQSFGYDEKADIWSLGTICYQLLIGTPPFDATSYDELIFKITNGNYNIPKDLNLSKEAISLINGMLQYDPNARLNINQIANHAFLNKNVKDFTKVNLKVYQNKEELILNTKQNAIWGIFECNVENIKEIIDIPKSGRYSIIDKKLIEGQVTDTISQLSNRVNGLKINNNSSNEKKDPENSGKQNVSEDLKKKLLKAFDNANNAFFFLEPMLVPIKPIDEQKPLQLDF